MAKPSKMALILGLSPKEPEAEGSEEKPESGHPAELKLATHEFLAALDQHPRDAEAVLDTLVTLVQLIDALPHEEGEPEEPEAEEPEE